jgi:hypothetical protein
VVLNSRWVEKYYHFRAMVCFSIPLKNRPLKYAKFTLKARVHSCTLTVLHSVMFIFQSENMYQNFPVLGSNSSEKDLAFESYCVSKQRQDTFCLLNLEFNCDSLTYNVPQRISPCTLTTLGSFLSCSYE